MRYTLFVTFFRTLALVGAAVSWPALALNKGAEEILKIAASYKGQLSISVVALSDKAASSEVVSFKSDAPIKPASILKILTSSLVLREFGPDFVFETPIYIKRVGKETTITIRGQGDPSLTTEEAWLIARQIRMRGITEIDTLIIDNTAFGTEARSPIGQRAYQTGPSAMAFNFNSVGFSICPGEKKNQKAIVSGDPWESGVTVQNNIITVSGSGEGYSVDEGGGYLSYVLKGKIGEKADCETFYRSVDAPGEYFGKTVTKLLSSVGVRVAKEPKIGVVAADSKKLFTHTSKPLSSIVNDLNHFSTNFIGEQLVYLLGRKRAGGNERYQFNRGEGVSKLMNYAQELGLKAENCVLVDGCGLSHQNKITARVLTAALDVSAKDPSIAPEFETSLAVAAKSGTLKKRDFIPATMVLRGKTGTLDGVSSLAGYLYTKQGKKLAFAIIQNGVSSKNTAIIVEDKLIRALYQLQL